MAESSPSKRAIYIRFTLAILTVGVVLKTCWFSRLGPWEKRDLVDFDAFYIAAQRVWLGDIDQAYQFLKFAPMQQAASNGGKPFFMPWTYPPQFDLLVAPFAFLPVGTAYFLFTVTTLAFYLLVLRRIAGSYFALLLALLLPTLAVTMACGQNGFLTGALVGLACLTFQRQRAVAGLALGTMVIKPHLAVALAAYSLLTRCWMIALTAAAVVLVSSVLATLLLGFKIWSAFLEGVRESGIFLEKGFYPLFRMISPYAALWEAGFPSWAAFLGQAVVALLGLAVIVFAIRREFMPRWSLGLAAMVSVLMSPYAYDYDLPVFGIGLALLLPDLVRLGSERERSTIYGLILLAGLYGLLQSSRLQLQYGDHVDPEGYRLLSLGGIAVVVMLCLIFRVLLRDHSGRDGPQDAEGGKEYLRQSR